MIFVYTYISELDMVLILKRIIKKRITKTNQTSLNQAFPLQTRYNRMRAIVLWTKSKYAITSLKSLAQNNSLIFEIRNTKMWSQNLLINIIHRLPRQSNKAQGISELKPLEIGTAVAEWKCNWLDYCPCCWFICQVDCVCCFYWRKFRFVCFFWWVW